MHSQRVLPVRAMHYFLAALIAASTMDGASAAGLDQANAGLAAAERGEFDEAIRLFSAALAAGDLSPGNAVIAIHNRGNAFQDKGDYRNAITQYDTEIRMKPNGPEGYYARGRARFSVGEFAGATTDFVRSLTFDPSDAYSVLWLYLTRSKTGQGSGTELQANAAKLDLSHWPGPLVNLYLERTTSQLAQMASLQGDGRMQREQSCEAAFYIGEYELMRKNGDEAKTLFRQAVKNCPFLSDERDGATAELKRTP